MAIRVGINGFGRIGRQVLRAAKQAGITDLDFVAVNDLTDTKTLAHLFKYDSVHREYQGSTSALAQVPSRSTATRSRSSPRRIRRSCRGRISASTSCSSRPAASPTRTKAAQAHRRRREESDHLRAGEGRGHHHRHGREQRRSTTPAKHHIVSNASCTTNCLVPMVKVVRDNFGFVHGSMVTIHSYTNDQKILDLPHKDLRRARAAALSIIPTTTGAAKATSLVIPEVKGKIDGIAIRVPTPDVSFTDLAVEVEQGATPSTKSTRRSRRRADGPLKGILAVHRGGARLVATTSATRTRASSTRRAPTSSTARCVKVSRLVRQRVGLRVALRRPAAVHRRAALERTRMQQANGPRPRRRRSCAASARSCAWTSTFRSTTNGTSPTTRASAPRSRRSSCCSTRGARVVLLSHLGRPKGKPDPKYSLAAGRRAARRADRHRKVSFVECDRQPTRR